MPEPSITLHFDPGPELTEPLGDALRAFNESAIGSHRREVVLALARDEGGELLGGIQGAVIFGWLYIDRLWVAEGHRGRGLGSALLRTLERAAAERGARRATLHTADWQAPEFYAKRGYETVATFDLTLDGGGGRRAGVDHLLVKRLDPAGGGAG